jgi:ABC-2 type transport system ATP-binding protein
MKSSAFGFKEVSKNFQNIKALDGISLDIPVNSIFGLLGPNGSGKSTLMRILAGLIQSWDGTLNVGGKLRTSGNNEHLKDFGFLIEAPSFYEYLSAFDNLKILSRLMNINTESINEVLETVNLTDRANDKVKTYSYGMKQRLGLAQCLLHDPQILILDEPNNGLDPSGIREMSRIIHGLHKNGKTICISTHILSEVDSLCTHAAILQKGKKIATLELDEKYHSYTTYLIQSDNSQKTMDDLKEVPEFQFKTIDERNLILKTKLQNVTNLIKDIDPNSSNNKTITKQSNLLEFFNA